MTPHSLRPVPEEAVEPRVFVFGITGRVGRLLTTRLRARDVPVSGLVRTPDQAAALREEGVSTHVGALGAVSSDELATMLADVDVVVYAAGSNAGPQSVTDDIDLAAVDRVSEAVAQHPGTRLILLSVLPEAWRERSLSDDEEHYFAVKKTAEVRLTRRDLDWMVLRPSLLTDDPGSGHVSLGPAEHHGEIARADVAAVLEALVLAPSVARRILELNDGGTPIPEAVRRHTDD
ncbi:NAD(P)H-binding protein [Frigoribacterium sp. VKM Ac-2530]|uniref:NAD(P)H-binding protein n=1 Tax=Frigoribacterium sp. VKM Ac-2530 TaxID=2783822 RepID=UPI00188A8865|nr:NAD(P)H-binding protein [Frigoribacterium sp. VKM Ac-2530]MBF4580804.1 NAD(P)H-binding protein [Frigoribacterium sp. VKM Ac-2530]